MQSGKISNGESIGVSDSTMRCIVTVPNCQCQRCAIQNRVAHFTGRTQAAGTAGPTHLAVKPDNLPNRGAVVTSLSIKDFEALAAIDFEYGSGCRYGQPPS